MLKKLLLATAVTALYLYFAVNFWSRFVADVYHKESGNLLGQNFAEGAIASADNAIFLNKHEPEYYRQRAKSYILLGMKAEALEDLKTAHSLNQDNMAVLRDSVPLYYFLAFDDYEKPLDKYNIDSDYLDEALAYFSLVKNKYPDDVGVLVDIAKFERRLGIETYDETIKRIGELRPDLLDWHPNLNE
jgi:tetratricopeptide (TPR) repeat protein